MPAHAGIHDFGCCKITKGVDARMRGHDGREAGMETALDEHPPQD